MKNAKDVSALKAVSQNLIHSSITITDGVYGILSNIDVRNKILELSEIPVSHSDDEKIIYLLETLLDR